MGKLYIRKNTDGTYNLRGVRLDGKELAENVVRKNITRRDLKTVVAEIGEKIANPKRRKLEVEDSTGIGRIA
jgi:hypothetical protein